VSSVTQWLASLTLNRWMPFMFQFDHAVKVPDVSLS